MIITRIDSTKQINGNDKCLETDNVGQSVDNVIAVANAKPSGVPKLKEINRVDNHGRELKMFV